MVSYFMLITSFCCSFVYAPSCTTIGNLPISVDSQQLGYGTEPYIVYLFGGIATNAGINSNDIYKWNVSSNTYVKLTTKTPTASFYTWSNNAVQIKNVIYFVGMYNTQYVHLFDVATETWINNTNISPLSIHATYGCLTGNETHLFFIGGLTSLHNQLYIVQIYDIVSNKWNSQEIDIAPIKNTGWDHGYCQFVDGNIYIFGGVINDVYYVGDPLNVVSDIFTLDASMQWSHIGNLPMALTYGISIRYYNYIYIIGGGYDAGEEMMYMNVIYEFDTKIHQITKQYEDIMIKPLCCVSAAIINDNLYIFGGLSSVDDSNINDVQLCDILNNTGLSTTNAPTFRPNTEIPTIQITTISMIHSTFEPSTQPSKQQTTKNPTVHTTITETTSTSIIQSTFESTPMTSIVSTSNNSTYYPSSQSTTESSTHYPSSQSTKESSIVIQTTNESSYEFGMKQLLFIGIGSVLLGILVSVIVICICMYCKRDKSINKLSYEDGVQLAAMYPEPGQIVIGNEVQNEDNAEEMYTEEGVRDKENHNEPQIEYNMDAFGDEEVIGNEPTTKTTKTTKWATSTNTTN